MLDEILDYVKFLRLQVKVFFFKKNCTLSVVYKIYFVPCLTCIIVLQFKVLSMSRLGGAGAVAQLVADIPLPVKVTRKRFCTHGSCFSLLVAIIHTCHLYET
jgi:hypothetical protein